MRIIGFHGLREGAGASFVSASCACRMTVTSGRVLAVDAHPCVSSMNRLFNLPLRVHKGWLEAAAGNSDALPLWRYAEKLDVLPAGRLNRAATTALLTQCFGWLIEQARLLQYDALVIDAGPVSSPASRALRAAREVLSVTIVEPDASGLARLVDHAFGESELLLLNKTNAASAAHKSVMLVMNKVDAISRRLIPVSIPWDEFVLEACLVKRPVVDGLSFAQSAESINNLVSWLDSFARNAGAV